MDDAQLRRDLLRNTGVQFPKPHHTATLLRDVEIDTEVMHQISTMYARAPMDGRLRDLGASAASLREAYAVISHALHTGTVWGVSGFATGATPEQPLDYIKENNILSAFYTYISNSAMRPSLIVDGGCSEGILGLNGYFAEDRGLPNLGYIPFEGLTSMSARQHMVVWGDTYRDRELLVGTTSQILLCMGGADGTIRECLRALLYNSPVILVEAKHYDDPRAFTNVYASIPQVQQAMQEKRFFFCREVGELYKAMDAAIKYSDATRHDYQEVRLGDIGGFFNVRA